MRQPFSLDVSHCTIIRSTQSSHRTSWQSWVPTPGQAHECDLKREHSDFKSDMLIILNLQRWNIVDSLRTENPGTKQTQTYGLIFLIYYSSPSYFSHSIFYQKKPQILTPAKPILDNKINVSNKSRHRHSIFLSLKDVSVLLYRSKLPLSHP